MTHKLSQNEIILSMLRERGERGVTLFDVLPSIENGGAGCSRLAARIPEIASNLPAGESIVNRGHVTREGKHVARYVIVRRVSETCGKVAPWGSVCPSAGGHPGEHDWRSMPPTLWEGIE